MTYSGLRVQALNGLLAWAVAHNAEQAMVAGQAELKDKLRAALPVFTRHRGRDHHEGGEPQQHRGKLRRA